MKKIVFVFAAAAVLAACTKTEVIPVHNDADVEITFETSPITKTLADSQSEFTHGNVFASYAYSHEKTWDWGASETPQLYIGKKNTTTDVITPATISWVGNTTTGVWKDATMAYYWPKSYKLTFFAWSLNKADLDFADHTAAGQTKVNVTCTPSQGVIMSYYDVAKDKNVDFLVADIAADQTKNSNTYVREGVPTLFKHKLSMMAFTAKVASADYAENGITFTLNSIKFKNVADGVGTYCQRDSEGEEKLVASGSKTTQTYSSTSQVVKNTTATDVTGVDQYIYIPQSFTDDNQVLEIVYTVDYDTDNDGVTEVSETVTEIIKLSALTGDWGIGKKYVINITFSLDEILWDPAVEDWTGVTKNVPVE